MLYTTGYQSLQQILQRLLICDLEEQLGGEIGIMTIVSSTFHHPTKLPRVFQCFK
jgi:hypothetical protein